MALSLKGKAKQVSPILPAGFIETAFEAWDEPVKVPTPVLPESSSPSKQRFLSKGSPLKLFRGSTPALPTDSDTPAAATLHQSAQSDQDTSSQNLDDGHADPFAVEAQTDEEQLVHDKRPAGKLFGRSLLDELDDRKAEMKAKQRAFMGDNRRKMMTVPEKQQQHSVDGTSRPRSTVPTSTSDSDDEPLMHRYTRQQAGKSVFGVDHIMARELEKLETILKVEAEEAEEEAKLQRIIEEKRQAKEAKRAKKVKHGRLSALLPGFHQSTDAASIRVRSRTESNVGTDAGSGSERPEDLLAPSSGRPSTDSARIAADVSLPGHSHHSHHSSSATADEPPTLTLPIVDEPGLSQTGAHGWFDQMVDSASDSDEHDEDEALAESNPTSDAMNAFTLPVSVSPARQRAQLIAKGKISLDIPAVADDGSLGLNDLLLSPSCSPASSEHASVHSEAVHDRDDDMTKDDDVPLALRTTAKQSKDPGDDAPLGYLHPEAVRRQRDQSYDLAVRQQHEAFMAMMGQQLGMASVGSDSRDSRDRRIDSWRQCIDWTERG